MDKKDLIEYLYAIGSRFGASEMTNDANSALFEKFQNLNEQTSYLEMYNLIKEAQVLTHNQDQMINTMAQFLENLKEQEIKAMNIPPEEPKEEEKLQVATANVKTCENISKEGIMDIVSNAKEAAENGMNFLKVHISLLGDDKIVINVNQFGDNIKGNETSYQIIYDRYLFNQLDISSSINEALISNDKIEKSDNQRFFSGKALQTNYGHQLIIDPNVKEAIAQTDEYVNSNKKGNPRTRTIDNKENPSSVAATSNIVVFSLVLVIFLTIAYLVFVFLG